MWKRIKRAYKITCIETFPSLTVPLSIFGSPIFIWVFYIAFKESYAPSFIAFGLLFYVSILIGSLLLIHGNYLKIGS